MQILEHNICHINKIAMQNTILIAKVLVKSVKKKELIVDTSDAEIIRVYNTIIVLLKYNWHLVLMNDKATVDLRLQNVKKY